MKIDSKIEEMKKELEKVKQDLATQRDKKKKLSSQYLINLGKFEDVIKDEVKARLPTNYRTPGFSDDVIVINSEKATEFNIDGISKLIGQLRAKKKSLDFRIKGIKQGAKIETKTPFDKESIEKRKVVRKQLSDAKKLARKTLNPKDVTRVQELETKLAELQ